MSRVILARLRESPDRRADRRVHFFDVQRNQEDDARKALCGFTAHHAVLELVPEVLGLVCELCIAVASVGSPETDSTSIPPEDDPDSPATYAVALRGELVWHQIPERRVVDVYEGREVVVAECGCIAFLVFGTPPERYERCPECATFREVSE